MTVHEILMQRCLDLAIKGIGHVAPNPMVGCAIVADGQVIGEGYHQQYGGPHAEVNAVNSVPENLREKLKHATLYVNLEPCSHFGKTPPCADMIIQHNIPKVVIGSNDPNPLVAGKGIQKLRDAGVEVITGVLKSSSDFLNRRFLTFWQKQRPYILLKWAQSADGFMALNEPKQFWFSSETSKKIMHQWRSEETAILAGRGTIEIDNPALTTRLVEGKNPIRITIDKDIKLKSDFAFFEPNARFIVFNAHTHEGSFVKIDFTADVLKQVMDCLFAEGIQSVMIEGGPATLKEFIKYNLWDEARVFTSNHILKTGKQAPVLRQSPAAESHCENDTLRFYFQDGVFAS